MTSTKQTAFLAVALLATSQGFAPLGSVRQVQNARSTVSMSAQQGPKAQAAAFLAGVLSIGAAFDASPVDAAIFDSSSTTPALQRDVGFGQPNPSSDPTNNNAESGRENGSKYDIQQQGSFADKNSAGAVDYGSAKGTDFGKLAGGKQGVATETKATDGDFLADAKQNTREGVKIAEKNTKDAANVDFGKDFRTSKNAQTVGEGLQAAKNAVTGGASNSAAPTWGGVQGGLKGAKDKVASAADQAQPRWGKWTGQANTAKVPAKSLNNGFTSSFKAVPGAVSDAASSVENKVKSDVSAAKNVANSAKSATNAAKSATSDLRNPNVDASLFGKSGNQVASSAKSAAQDALPSKGELNNAANAAKNKVSSDVNAVKQAADNAAPNSLQGAAAQAKNAVTSNAQDAKNALKDATGAEKGSPASVLLSSTLLSNAEPDGGFFGTQPREAAAVSGQKTVDTIKDNVATARANPPFQGETSSASASGAANSAANAVKGKVQSDIKNTRQQWQYAKREVTNNAPSGRQAARAVSRAEPNSVKQAKSSVFGKVKADVAAVDRNTPNSLSQGINAVARAVDNNTPNLDVNGAKNAVTNKVRSDVNTAKRNVPNAPKAGGFFGLNARKQAAQVGQKTADKVKSDIAAVERGAPSYGGDVKDAVKGAVSRATN